jgi:hypothetical protein
MKTEFLGKAAVFFRPGLSVSEKYAFIDAEKAMRLIQAGR